MVYGAIRGTLRYCLATTSDCQKADFKYYFLGVRIAIPIIVPASQPSVIDNSDHSVTDSKTGLTWVASSTTAMTWTEAKHHCAELRFGGHGDWRLPTKDELIALWDHGGFHASSGRLVWSSEIAGDMVPDRETMVLAIDFLNSRTLHVPPTYPDGNIPRHFVLCVRKQ